MYITEKDYAIISKALKLVNHQYLTDEQTNIIQSADIVLTKAYLKQKAINEKTSKKIMEKRKTDKTYCHK